MRSTFTHNVSRRLPVCHGFPASASMFSKTCLSPPRVIPSHDRAAVRHPHCRTIKLLKKSQNQGKDASFEPGFDTFLEFRANSVVNTKLPPVEDLINAFQIFFDYKVARKKPLNSSQAFCATLLFKYLRQLPPELKLAPDLLVKALYATAVPIPRGDSVSHVQFAKEVYEELNAIKFSGQPTSDQDRLSQLFSNDLQLYIIGLTRHNASQTAADILSTFGDLSAHLTPASLKLLDTLHMSVLKGFAREGDEQRLRKYAEELIQTGRPCTSFFHEIMTTFYAGIEKDGDGPLREWFEKFKSGRPTPDVYIALISFSFRTGCQPDWLKTAMQKLCDSNPPKAWWDVILRWAVYQGKDIDHIKHMIDIMMQINKECKSVRPDARTIEGLISAAVESNNPLFAERIYGMASELRLQPSIMTYSLLLEARIAGQDSVGASSAFEDLIHSNPSSSPKAYRVINQYVRHLCSSASLDYPHFLSVLGQIERREIELDPETIRDLCLMFLRNDNAFEVTDTLRLHIKQFSMADRQVVLDDLVQYCLDRGNSTARAWGCYSLLRQFFPELSRGERLNLMAAFFDRKRADMACNIFGHMRAHSNDSIRPDSNAYVLCLEGLGMCPDEESLEMIHNMFKMDTMIQATTMLHNAFMIAYRGCGQPRKAFDFWQQISTSTEGPTYDSLSIVLRVCQSLPYGDVEGKVIWDKMHRMEIDIPIYVYVSYVVMHAGQGHLVEVKDLLISMGLKYGKEADFNTIAEVFNAFIDPEIQEEFKKWVAQELPEARGLLSKAKTTQTVQGTERILLPQQKLRASQ